VIQIPLLNYDMMWSFGNQSVR